MMLRLEPPYPVHTPLGKGDAIVLIDPGYDMHLQWVVVQELTGEIWTWENPEVRAQTNKTSGRATVDLPEGWKR